MGFSFSFKQFLILLFPVITFGQTRLYYAANKIPPISWSVSSDWTVNTAGNSTPYWMLYSYNYSRNLSQVYVSAQAGATSPPTIKMILKSFATSSLDNQTLNCTINIQTLCKRNASGSTQQLLIYARLINEDGSVAQELGNSISTDFASSTSVYTNRTNTITLSSVSITSGQRIAFEEGINQTVGTATTSSGSIDYSFDILNPELPVDNTTTGRDNYNCWIEFTQTLKYKYKQGFF